MKFIIILLILSFFSAIVYIVTRKFASKLLPLLFLFGMGVGAGLLVPLSESVLERVAHLIYNLLPATIFLIVLDFDPKCWISSGVGCACKMGAKRYWILVVLALVASFLSQFLSMELLHQKSWWALMIFGAFFGVVASWSSLRNISGSKELATTLSFLLSGLVGLYVGALEL